MRRVIDGKAYNTKTAQAVVRWTGEGSDTKYARGRGFRIQEIPFRNVETVYRTKDGRFFVVTEKTQFIGEHSDERRIVEFEPISYDEVYKAINDEAEILVPNIFPTALETQGKSA